ncbi:MAG: family 20 glycosylhydrolase, partial [Candidatus Aminicenantes bacterium]|nr:family 20 glycosylhydrolase [Candidatus Aminicenantes bacterium]
MTLNELATRLELKVFTSGIPPDRPVQGGYASDLLSDVIGHARKDDLWVTLQVHPNIIAVYDIGSESGHYYFTMDYIEGRSLKDLIKKSFSRHIFIINHVTNGVDQISCTSVSMRRIVVIFQRLGIIKKYPELMKTGAWRVDREELPWTERHSQEPGEKATYGGYYTQGDIREIVAYAKDRYIR